MSASASQPAPTLEVVRARIDVGGRPAIDGLSFATTSDRALVLGAARALFEAASGVRPVTRGEVRVAGVRAASAIRAAGVAAAPLDPRLPPRWTVRAYVTWSARLAGQDRGRARSLANHAIEELKIAHAAEEPLAKAPTVVRRATVVAAALATGARLLLLEDPTENLDDQQSRDFGRILLQALLGRASVIFAARMPLASPLCMEAEDAIVVAGSDVAAQGAPAELASQSRRLALRVLGDTAGFARAAEERGAKVGGTGPLLRIDLGESLKVCDLLRLAGDASATVLEVRPIALAFA